MSENNEFQEYLNGLYEVNSNWTKEQIADVLVYYSSKHWLVKYQNDMIYIFDVRSSLHRIFENFEQFKKEIWDNKQ